MALSIDWLYRDIFQIFDSAEVEEFFAAQQRMESQSGTQEVSKANELPQVLDAPSEPASEQIFLALSQKLEAGGSSVADIPSIDLSTPVKEPVSPEILPADVKGTGSVATEGTAAVENAVSVAIKSVESELDPATSAEAKNTLVQVAEVIKEKTANADEANTSSVPAETAEAVIKLLTLSQLAMPELRRVYEAFIRSSFPEDVAQEMIDVLHNPYYQVFNFKFALSDSFMDSRFSSLVGAVARPGADGTSELRFEEDRHKSPQHKDDEARRRQVFRDKAWQDRRAESAAHQERTSEKIRQFDLRDLTQSKRRV